MVSSLSWWNGFLDALLVLLAASISGGVLGARIGRSTILGQSISELQTIGTFGVVMVGAALYGLLGHRVPPESYQLLAGTATGLGFLAGAVIFRSKLDVQGTTTAALLWSSSAIGNAFGFQQWDLAIAGTLFLLVMIWFHEHRYPDLRLIDELNARIRGKKSGSSPH